MKRRVNAATLSRLGLARARAQRAMDEIGKVAEDVRRHLGVTHDEQNAKDHIMDFCSGDVAPLALLERLGIGCTWPPKRPAAPPGANET